jgi:predicted permease
MMPPSRLLDDLRSDCSVAFRALRGHAGFALVAVLTIALAIAGNSAIFGVVRAVLLKPLPYPDPENLAIVWNDFGQGQSFPAVSGADFLDYRARAGEVADFAAATSARANLHGPEGDPELVEVGAASADLLPMLGARPLLGRLFTAQETVQNGPRVVVLTHRLWARRFASDPSLIGRTILLNGEPRTVIGVLREGFRLVLPAEHFVLDQPDLWAPDQADVLSIPRNYTLYTVFARRRPGVSQAQLQQKMDALSGELRAEHLVHAEAGLRIRAVPLHEDVVKRVKPALLALFAAVGLLLLVACANLANLLLARATARERDLAVRSALGASPARLVRQALVESLLLGLLGGAAGVVLAHWAVAALQGLRLEGIPRIDEVAIDAPVFAFTALLALLAPLLFGALPALHASRRAPADALRGGLRDTGGPGAHGTRSLLVVAEIAVSVMLLICAGLLLRAFSALLRVDPGFSAEGVASLELQLSRERYPDGEAVLRFQDELRRRLSALPGVSEVGFVRQLPLTGSGPMQPYAWDEESARRWESVSADWRSASPGYFRALGVRLLAGRMFDERDDARHPRVAIVDSLFAARVFPGEQAVGKRILLEQNGQKTWREIVGVIVPVRLHDLARDVREQIYEPQSQMPVFRQAVVVRGADARALLRPMDQVVHGLDGQLAIRRLRPLSDLVDDARGTSRFVTALGSLFGLLALGMAALGLFGLLSFSVRQRTREIGVRMALGAGEARVLRMVLAGGLRLTSLGIGLGMGGAFLCSRALAAAVEGVKPDDLPAWLGAPLLLLAVALLACWAPARRAARVDPVVALNDG